MSPTNPQKSPTYHEKSFFRPHTCLHTCIRTLETLNRALHIFKRVLHTLKKSSKKALHTLKKDQNAFRWGQHTLKKNPTNAQHSPTYFQISTTYTWQILKYTQKSVSRWGTSPPLFWVYKGSFGCTLEVCRAFLCIWRALLGVCRSHLSAFRALLVVCRALYRPCYARPYITRADTLRLLS